MPDLDIKELRERFRTIVTLLPLVTGLNNNGISILRPNDFGTPNHGYLDPMQDKPSLAMNALAAILVRDHEVVAAAIRTPKPGNRVRSDSMTVLATGIVPGGGVEALSDKDIEDIAAVVSDGFTTTLSFRAAVRGYLPDPPAVAFDRLRQLRGQFTE
jgi:hypothetical protein